jgi:hypothetical protein
LVEDISTRLGSRPIFRHDIDVLPLKAADLLAWQIRRHLNEEQPQGVPHNNVLDQLLTIPGVSNHMEGKHLEELTSSLSRGINLKASAEFLLPPGV